MSAQVKRIGVKQGITDVSAEYARLADEDEAVETIFAGHRSVEKISGNV